MKEFPPSVYTYSPLLARRSALHTARWNDGMKGRVIIYLQTSQAQSRMDSKYSPTRGDHASSKRGFDEPSESKSAKSTPAPAKKASSSDGASAKYGRDDPFDLAEEKERIIEIQQDIEADEEFERLKLAPQKVEPAVGNSKFARNFVRGFQIISMNMRDAETGRLVWRSADWDVEQMFEQEISEEIPKEILQCRIVSREIVFSSRQEMNTFRLEQRVYFKGVCIEEWFFTFGYVMSGSRNSWQQTIDAAPPSEMLPAEVLSGEVVFETSFFDDKEFLCKNSVRIFYV